MTEEEMWKAIKENDESCDGIFFYGVKTTGIYCRPSCKSKLPKKENVYFFKTSENARENGFNPCKRCRSDLIKYKPMKEVALEVKQKIEEAYYMQCELAQKFKEVGLTARRLTDIFKDEYGMTPKSYVDSLRLEEAKSLLTNSEEKIIDIAYSIGFASLSAFYSFFKKKVGVTPSDYRKMEGNNK